LGILKVVMLADDLKHLGSELKQMEWMLRNPWMESMLTPKFNFPAAKAKRLMQMLRLQQFPWYSEPGQPWLFLFLIPYKPSRQDTHSMTQL
jgi:hypothetical protein